MDFSSTRFVKNQATSLLVSYLSGGIIWSQLAKAAFTPNLSLTAGMLTEANFIGYARRTSNGAALYSFFDQRDSSTVIVTGFSGVAEDAEIAGAIAGSQTMFGQYTTDVIAGVVVGSELFAAPVPILVQGDGVLLDKVFLRVFPSFML